MENTLFDEFECSQAVQAENTPVVCLGMEFANDAARREYFREELRKRLPDLKKIEGFPIGEDDDIINLSDPPYYTACPNPWLNDFIAEWEKEKAVLESQGKRKKDFEVKEPYASDVKASKSNPVYAAHTYHTKVPHPAVMRYILHYTQPGDIVFDGFCGTGMTGVAAQSCMNPAYDDKKNIESEWEKEFGKLPMWGQRHGICADLSPYASMVAYNYNTPLPAKRVKSEIERIYKETFDECQWLYETEHNKETKGLINYVVWSDVIICSNCGQEFVYWDAAVDTEKKQFLEEFYCPHCQTMHTKKADRAFETIYDDILGETISSVKSVPVLVVYSVGKKRFEKRATQYDIDLVGKINNTSIVYDVPKYMLPDGDETNRNQKIGITHIHQFYTRRNLIALATFLDKIQKSSLPNKLKFIFTGMINRSTKMNRVHFKNFFFGGGGWNAGHLKGTLYIPNIPVETSILEQIHDKLSLYLKAAPILPQMLDNALYVGSANCSPLADNSIDYIFTDPPFGANIMYSELNFLPEAWLKVLTNNQTEAIVNQCQEKDSMFYLEMMTKCYSEFYRILKPGKWMTVEFSNTNAGIWNSIQQALRKAGFIIANVAALNKGQGGMRSITTTTAVKQDLAISCYKPSEKMLKQVSDDKLSVNYFIEEHLNRVPSYLIKDDKIVGVPERDPRILYDRLISYYVQHGWPIPMDAQEFQKMLQNSFIERDGMFFTASQALEYEEKRKQTSGVVSMGLLIGSEADGIEWLNNKLQDSPMTYQDLQPGWIKDLVAAKKGDVIPELRAILEENFITDDDGRWRKPDPEKAADLEALRNKRMAKEFATYLEFASKPKAKRMKDCRLEVLRFGFKECYKQKDFKSIVLIGDHIQESLLQEDEVLLQYYDIALERI